jgi:hypothetical protein
MKNIILVGILLLVAVGGYLYFSSDETTEIDIPAPQNETPAIQQVTGVVTNVNFEQVAFDGPALITVADDNDQVHVIAIPSMGIRFCEASGRIADAWEVAVGDLVSVQGAQNDEGQIVPCVSAEHFFEITSPIREDGTETQDSSEATFTQTGNIVRNNPGMEANVWHLVYEAPGAPALTMPLRFLPTSVCVVGSEISACAPETFTQGERVQIQGDIEDESVVVARVELLER